MKKTVANQAAGHTSAVPVPARLTIAQRSGLACVYCGRDFIATAPAVTVPVGYSTVGQVFACADSTTGRQVCGVAGTAGGGR
ncbi:MAG TPA: hypothetical protein VIS06_07405 [Mycobacteriales bacterium]